MKCLRIKDGKGEFTLDGKEYLPLDQIDKDNLIEMLEIALDPEQEFEMDEYDSEKVTNPAHKVIYSNLYDKFTAVKANKEHFTSEIDGLYQEAFNKYKLENEETA
jgi:hypothetical protein